MSRLIKVDDWGYNQAKKLQADLAKVGKKKSLAECYALVKNADAQLKKVWGFRL